MSTQLTTRHNSGGGSGDDNAQWALESNIVIKSRSVKRERDLQDQLDIKFGDKQEIVYTSPAECLADWDGRKNLHIAYCHRESSEYQFRFDASKNTANTGPTKIFGNSRYVGGSRQYSLDGHTSLSDRMAFILTPPARVSFAQFYPLGNYMGNGEFDAKQDEWDKAKRTIILSTESYLPNEEHNKHMSDFIQFYQGVCGMAGRAGWLDPRVQAEYKAKRRSDLFHPNKKCNAAAEKLWNELVLNSGSECAAFCNAKLRIPVKDGETRTGEDRTTVTFSCKLAVERQYKWKYDSSIRSIYPELARHDKYTENDIPMYRARRKTEGDPSDPCPYIFVPPQERTLDLDDVVAILFSPTPYAEGKGMMGVTNDIQAILWLGNVGNYEMQGRDTHRACPRMTQETVFCNPRSSSSAMRNTSEEIVSPTSKHFKAEDNNRHETPMPLLSNGKSGAPFRSRINTILDDEDDNATQHEI